MKTFVAATLITLASVATAQLDNIPSCALSCFVTPLTTDGCSSLTDFACHCKKFDTLISSVTPCVQSSCSASDQATVISAVESTCASAGVTVSVSVPSSTGGSSSSASKSAAPSSSAPSSYSVTSAPSSSAKTVSTSASVSGKPTTSSNSTITKTSTPTASQFPGAGAKVTQAAGLLGAAALALLAL